MSILGALDATRICSRWSESLTDPEAWVTTIPAPVRSEPLPTEVVPFSWRSLARNPQALLLTAVITAGLVLDTLGEARMTTQTFNKLHLA